MHIYHYNAEVKYSDMIKDIDGICQLNNKITDMKGYNEMKELIKDRFLLFSSLSIAITSLSYLGED